MIVAVFVDLLVTTSVPRNPETWADAVEVISAMTQRASRFIRSIYA
jgi:hypothetical protein